MTVLVVGISHKSAPVQLLEQFALDTDGVAKLIRSVGDVEHVTEVTMLSTCNRVEVYAAVDRFHGSVEAISALLAQCAGHEYAELIGHLYVHYDDAAVSHLLRVAAGLDSLAIGESQILGQARVALRTGQESGSVGPVLNSLFQQALRVGKRAHAETDIDRVAPSLIATALDQVGDRVGSLAGSRALIVGAGAMAGLVAATLRRSGAGSLTILNRTRVKAERLAQAYDAAAGDLVDLEDHLAASDVVVACAGAKGVLLDESVVRRVVQDRRTPLSLIDLALPHDIAPSVADLPQVELVTLTTLAEALNRVAGVEVSDVENIVDEEVQAFLAARRSASVAPTVVALRSMATGVVDAELDRLATRIPDLDEHQRAEVERAIRRVADKLLHQPTVRVKELAEAAGAVSYADALAELFSLDPQAVEAVTRPGGAS